MKKYLMMAGRFSGDVTINYNGHICDDKSFFGSTDIAEDYYAPICHSINSHDELVAMNKELLAALEWSDSQIVEFISIAFRHAQIKGDFELSDVRDALNMIVAKSKAAS